VRRPEDDRVFAGAVAASLALHTLLLAGVRLPPPKEAPALPEGTILVTRLMEAPTPAEPPREEPPKPRAQPKKEPRRPKPAVVPRKEARLPVEQVPSPAPAPPPQASAPAQEESANAPGSAAQAASGVASSVQVPGVQAAPDAGSIARYRQQLIALAARYKRYPPRAVDEGWEGNVVVRISVAPGAPPQIALKSGSGHDVLDAQALAMFRSAAPQLPVPPALTGSSFAVEVPVLYSLKD
jgi:protein TonB